MKIAVIALILVGSAFLCLQADAGRSILDEVKKEKATHEVQTAQKLEASKSGANDIKSKDSEKKSVPAGDASDQKYTSNTTDGNNKKAEEKNDDFGTNGTSSDSSIDSHHRFADENPPHRPITMED